MYRVLTVLTVAVTPAVARRAAATVWEICTIRRFDYNRTIKAAKCVYNVTLLKKIILIYMMVENLFPKYYFTSNSLHQSRLKKTH